MDKKAKAKKRLSLKKDLKKDNSQTQLTHFFLKKTTTDPSTISPSPLTVSSNTKITKAPTLASSPLKKSTPTKSSQKARRLSLKRTRGKSKKDKTTPTSESPGTDKQMRLDDCRAFTPTKLAYVLDRGTLPDVLEVVKSPPTENDNCSVSGSNCVKRNLFNKKEISQSVKECSLIRDGDIINEELVTFSKRTNQENRKEHEMMEREMIEGETLVDKMEDFDQAETKLEEDSATKITEEEIGLAMDGVDFKSDSNDFSLFGEGDDLDEIFKSISVNYNDDDVSHDSHVTFPPRYEVTTVNWERYRDENNGRTKTQIVLNLVPFSKYKEEGKEKKDKKILCYLRDDWIQSDIRVGDMIHIVPSCSTLSEALSLAHSKDYFVISNDNGGCIIINPDYLISVTNLSNGITCTRRPILEDLFKVSGQTEGMLVGKLLHEMFQKAIQAASEDVSIVTRDHVLSFIPSLVNNASVLQELYVLGLTDGDIIESLTEHVDLIVAWCHQYQNIHYMSYNNSKIEWKRFPHSETEMANVCITGVTDIEESVWSPRFGLKGKVDATLKMKVTDSTCQATEHLVPLEVKTGQMISKYGAIQHRAQVLLYCLMLCDSHVTTVPAGLLYYMKSNETISVLAKDNEIRALLIARNHLARYHGNHWDHVTLPEMLREPRVCQHCPRLMECSLYHKVFENGTAESSGLREHYPLVLDQMSPLCVDFYRHWHSLVMEEMTHEQSESIRDAIWRTVARDRVREGSCVNNLLSCQPESLNEGPGGNLKVKQTFLRQGTESNSHVFSMYDRIHVSHDDINWSIAMGYIMNINEQSITLALDKSVPVGQLYTIDPTLGRYGSLVLSTLAAVCSSDGEREQQLRELVIELREPRFSKGKVDILSSSEESLLLTLNEQQRQSVQNVSKVKAYKLLKD